MEQIKVNNQVVTDKYALYHGDSCEIIKGIPDNSVHYQIFSPPFASLYTYSNSERDFGNCSGDEKFAEHMKFLTRELLRISKPGRLLSFHCMNLPTSKAKDGFIGVKDFRGELIRAFTEAGWIYHSEVCIWKDPVTAMQRTKALGLLHKQVMKDSAMSRQGLADYLVTMRKPGTNDEPVNGCFNTYSGEPENEPTDEFAGNFERLNRYSINVWQRYASPVWMDIRQGHTLNKVSARNEDDVKHLCPLQLDVIDRAIELWTNKGDVVFSPFMGIGSEGYCALRAGRKFIGIELKDDYFRESAKNIKNYEVDVTKRTAVKRKKIVDGEPADVPHNENPNPIEKVLPKAGVKEVASSNLRLKVFGRIDTIENHFAQIHENEMGHPTCYADLKGFADQTSWKVSATKNVGLSEHTTKYNFGLQFYALMWYKFINDEGNKGFVNQIRQFGLPEVFTTDKEMSQLDIKALIDNRAELLAIAQELNAILKASK